MKSPEHIYRGYNYHRAKSPGPDILYAPVFQTRRQAAFRVLLQILVPCVTSVIVVVMMGSHKADDSQYLSSEITGIKKVLTGILPIISRSPSYHSINTRPPTSSNTLGVVVAANAHVRRQPTIESDILTTLPGGTVLITRSRQGEWISTITPLGEPGWIHASLLSAE